VLWAFFDIWTSSLKVAPMLFIEVGKTYRAVLFRSIEQMSQGMNASM
jgi:hypothetical protein